MAKNSATLWFVLSVVVLAGSACTTVERIPVPESLVDKVSIQGFPDARFWGDSEPPQRQERAQGLLRLLRAEYAGEIEAGAGVQVSFLAISGGGSNGAFAAGFLNGWSRSGDRPSFRMVSGVSTGAIIAPFAFLGSGYDAVLREAYTETAPSEIYRASIFPNLFGGVALADVGPLEGLIANYIDEELLRAVAEEHARGRRLFITTTNIDAGRPVIWDMGTIAASRRVDAVELFRKVILASASLPGVFPPVQFDVVRDGDHYTELHLDGGVSSQVVAYHPQVELGRLLEGVNFDVDVTVYVIWNGRSVPAYVATNELWYEILERSIDVQFTHQGVGDVRRIYSLTQRDGAAFRLATIPEEFSEAPDELFDQAYMRELFGVGEQAAAERGFWLTEPP